MSGVDTPLGQLDAFRVRGEVFMDGLVKVLHWAHATKGIRPNVAQLELTMSFEEVVHLVRDKRLPVRRGSTITTVDVSDIPEDVIAPVRAYLNELADYDPNRPADTRERGAARDQHDWVLHSLRRDLESYIL